MSGVIESDHEDYATVAQRMCDGVSEHVHECKRCQRRLSFDPIEKSLLQTHSITNEILELIAFIVLGLMIIISLCIMKTGSPR